MYSIYHKNNVYYVLIKISHLYLYIIYKQDFIQLLQCSHAVT